MSEVHERNEVCMLEFQTLKDKVAKLEEKEEKRSEEFGLIGKAIVAIQMANEQTAKTLEKLDSKIESRLIQLPFLDSETKKNLLKYGMWVIIVLILALVGTNMLEGVKATGVLK